MAEDDDVSIGRRLLELKRITREELTAALFDLALERRRESRAARPLGVLLVSRGKLTQGELNRLLQERLEQPLGEATASQKLDLALGDLLVAASAATREQVEECLRIQREARVPGAPSKRLGELLVEKGYSTAAQIQRALSYHNKVLYVCGSCHRRFNVQHARPGKSYPCPKCSGPLQVASSSSVAVTGSTVVLRQSASGFEIAAGAPASESAPAPAAEPPVDLEGQVQMDRAVHVYLKQKVAARRDALREAQRFQMELSRYGLWAPFLDIMLKFGGITWQQAEQVRQANLEAVIQSDAWKQQAVPGYRVVGKIASGGFATIFAAEPVFGGNRVALKVLHADRARDPKSVARFRHEAALMIRLNHAGLVKGYDYTEFGSLHFLSMELVEGDSLDRLVRESQRINYRRALRFTAQIAETLRYMQTEGFIHRDVKPENILITRQDRTKVCDLGFALEMRPDARGTTATTVGTAAYMSPEQARGEMDLKVGTDIYALGLTLYFMLTAQAPFSAGSSTEILTERFAQGAVHLDLDRVVAPRIVVDLLIKMTHAERDQRFRTYAELVRALSDIRQDEHQ